MAKIYGFKASDGEPKGVAVNDDGELIVNADSSALPMGAATSAKQDTGNTSLSSIDGKLPALVGGKVPVDALAKILERVQLHTNIDFTSASAQTIIAAPGAGNRIRLTRLSLSSGGTPQVNVEIALKSGSTAIETVKGAAMVLDFPEHRNLDTNEAFVLQCTTADRVIGGVDYYVEAV